MEQNGGGFVGEHPLLWETDLFKVSIPKLGTRWLSRWAPAIITLAIIISGVVFLILNSGMDFDTFLNYFALGLLIFVIVTLFYGIIAIHDVPYEIAKSRGHPHQDAIHAAGWVSLFTLHAIWPFLWIWAMLYRPERGWGFQTAEGKVDAGADLGKLDVIFRRVEVLEARQHADKSDEYLRRLEELEKRLRIAKVDDQPRRAEEELESAPMRRIG